MTATRNVAGDDTLLSMFSGATGASGYNGVDMVFLQPQTPTKMRVLSGRGLGPCSGGRNQPDMSRRRRRFDRLFTSLDAVCLPAALRLPIRRAANASALDAGVRRPRLSRGTE
ncbi:hypothetical protein GCM10023170_092900 [Phytohabitans houttuyneae]|uniref:Uncharacterized protein n=1 Tax=Phytohabitans houttuyneae TaxID=1076126 RepID=A0A6V8K6U9_9ACTN|nr:hypothetical protein Phou_051030 [Phytohabitans houttuyneae]